MKFGRLSNQYAGSFAQMGKDAGKAFVGSYQDYIGRAVEYVRPFTQARARKRLAKDAEDAGKEAGKAAAKAIKKEVEDKFGIELAKSVKALSDKLLADLLKNGRGLNEILSEINSGTEQRVNGWEREANAVADYNEQLYNRPIHRACSRRLDP